MFGVIGLGQMGGSIARKLLAEGAEQVAGTPAELVALCSNSADSVVIVVVRDDAEVQNVVCGKKGILTGISEIARKVEHDSWLAERAIGSIPLALQLEDD